MSFVSTNLQLNRDFPDGLFGFFDAAEKKYCKVNIYDAVEKCNEKAWNATKQIFIKNPTLPLFAEVAIALETSILKLAATSPK